MKCPVCETVELIISERQGVEIDYCPQCRGVWLDRSELDKIIERTLAQERFVSKPQPRPDTTRKRKNDEIEYYDERDYHYDEDDRHQRGKPRRRKSFLDEIFDILD